MLENKLGTICGACQHRYEEHQGGERCEACDCKAFESAPASPTFICTECGITSTTEICIECAKTITDRCPGDLLDYLFGIKGDASPRIGRDTLIRTKAKRMAMDIRSAGLDVRALWDFWKANH